MAAIIVCVCVHGCFERGFHKYLDQHLALRVKKLMVSYRHDNGVAGSYKSFSLVRCGGLRFF